VPGVESHGLEARGRGPRAARLASFKHTGTGLERKGTGTDMSMATHDHAYLSPRVRGPVPSPLPWCAVSHVLEQATRLNGRRGMPAWLGWSAGRNRTAATSGLGSGWSGCRPVGRSVCRRRGRVVCRAGWFVRSAARLAAFSPASRLCPPCELFACHRERVGGREVPARRPLLSSPVRAGRLARMARQRVAPASCSSLFANVLDILV
jgi:hypothetical protein